jgi:phenylacetate-CoA ligase
MELYHHGAANPAVAEARELSPETKAFLQQYARWLEYTEKCSRDEIAAWQALLLRRLVTFAFNESPFYRERLSPLFWRDEEADLRFWGEVPILRRVDVERELDRICPAQVPAEAGAVIESSSSATTGAPLKFHTCSLARMVEQCMMHRLFRWHRYDLHAALASVRPYTKSPRVFPEGVTESRWSYLGPPAPHHTIDLRTPTDQLVEWLVRRRPTYVVASPSIARDVAEHPAAMRIREQGLRGIVGIGEGAMDKDRAVVRERLGCEIAQVYGAAELGAIALQSPALDGMLLCEESVLVEVLNDDGQPVGEGETGRVVLTGLYNYATPFIRYDIGDYVTTMDGPCPSGLKLKGLWRVEGRMRNALKTADGRRIWPSANSFAELRDHMRARRWQIRQPDLNTIELSYIPTEEGVDPCDGDLVARFSALIGRPVRLVTDVVAEMPRTRGGKFELVVSAVSG